MTKAQIKRVKRIVIIIMTMLIVLVMYGCCAWHDTHYTRQGIITDVTNNVITIIDASKNVWQFEGNGFNVNDTVILEMNTNCTDSIYDDIIENVKIK